MDRRAFFDSLRGSGLFPRGLSVVQVQVAEAILDAAAAAGLSDQHAAYILATGYGEAQLTPRRENMNYRAARIREVWPRRPEAVRFAGNPRGLANSVYGGRLGNRPGTDDGWFFRGGGVDQLTGRDNYRRFGIEGNPDAILRPDVAVRSLVHGLTTGRYRRHKLADFGDGAGFRARDARAIVNDDVARMGAEYARFYRHFLDAIRAGGGVGRAVAPVPSRPDGPAVRRSGWAALFGFLADLWKGGRDAR